MARRTRKAPKDYPVAIAFDENLEAVGRAFHAAHRNLPPVYFAIKGTDDDTLANDLQRVVFFTADEEWLLRQPPYDHGGIIFLGTGNLSAVEKIKIIRDFLFVFHLRHKSLDVLKNRRFRLMKTALFEETPGEQPRRIW